MAETLVCSGKGCRAEAGWTLLWNNPKLHTPERRKEWLACDEHKEPLSAFLGARGFLKDTRPLSEPGHPSTRVSRRSPTSGGTAGGT